MEHRDVFLLEVIIEYCEQIARTVDNLDYDGFVNNADARDACALRVLQIGENAGGLSEACKNENKQVPWHEIVGLRNIIAHEYGNVDDEVLWEIVTEDIPVLFEECKKIIG